MNTEKEIKKTILAVTACPTGVAHTYMAQEKLEQAAKDLGYNIKVETHGSIGVKNQFTEAEIQAADVVIIAVGISLEQIEMERFNNKKIYHTKINDVIKDSKQTIDTALKSGEIQVAKVEDFTVKKKKQQDQSIVKHIMNGISFMIPFIVFAGITSALIAGIANAMQIDLSEWDSSASDGIKTMYILNQFANIGFLVMMPIAGAYIANSIAGRAALAPAFILTMLGNMPSLWWPGYFENVMVNNPAGDGMVSINSVMQPLNIVGAIIFGLAVGYMVKWINTKWKINRYVQPIMPIIIIPVFLTLIFGIIWIFTLGPVLGIAIGYLYTGILAVEKSGVGMALVGLLLGLLAGVDMGGPINKIASFGATAMIATDGGSAMGTAAAAFAVAPLGAGLATMIFRNKFKEDKDAGINASILGFMGVSESAIPFAVKYKWAAIVPNILCSGIAGMLAGLFQVQGHVGAWGGPIIAIFAGVTDVHGSFIGILWYLIAIAIGTAAHIIIFRILVEVQSKGHLSRNEFKQMFKLKKRQVDATK